MARHVWQFWDPLRGLQNMEIAMKNRALHQSARSLFDPMVTVWTGWDESLRAQVVEACAHVLAAVYRARHPQAKEKGHER